MTKVLKVQLIMTDDRISYKDFCSQMFILQRKTREFKNKIVQTLWEFNNWKMDFKNLTGSYPTKDDIFDKYGYNNESTLVYSKYKNEFPQFQKQNFSTSQQLVEKKYKNESKDVLKGEVSIVNYKSDQPIDLHGNSLKLIYDNELKDKWKMNISLFSMDYLKTIKSESEIDNVKYKDKITLSLTGGIQFTLKTYDKYQTAILERCLDNVYKISASKIIYDERKKLWMLYLSYSFENVIEDKKLNKDNIMGIDMGIVCAVYMAFNNSFERYKIDGGEINAFRNKVEASRKQKLLQATYCGDGRKGHGRETRLRKIWEVEDEKINNFRKETNLKYAKYIIQQAIKNNCGTIQMEDLTGISKGDAFLQKWSYYDLQQDIIAEGMKFGIVCKKINPYKTSQRCHKCGCIHEENRPKDEKGQAYFECIECGNRCNADYNASKNISTYGIEEIIKDYMSKKNKSNAKLKKIDKKIS